MKHHETNVKLNEIMNKYLLSQHHIDLLISNLKLPKEAAIAEIFSWSDEQLKNIEIQAENIGFCFNHEYGVNYV